MWGHTYIINIKGGKTHSLEHLEFLLKLSHMIIQEVILKCIKNKEQNNYGPIPTLSYCMSLVEL